MATVADLRAPQAPFVDARSYKDSNMYGVCTTAADQSEGDLIFAIQYRLETDPQGAIRGIAYPFDPYIQRLPVSGETVELIFGPSDTREHTTTAPKVYYRALNVHNHPHHSSYTYTGEVPFENDFIEQSTISPMKPQRGDLIIQGRFGQSMRFGQTVTGTTKNYDGVTSKPILILSNGQVETEDGFTPIFEDINQDYSSIYLTAPDQFVDLNLPTHITFTSNPEEPKFKEEFKNSQVIINGDRLHLNSKLENVLITSSKYVSVGGTYINLEASENINLHATKIYLHNDSRTEAQPAALGKSLVDELQDLYNYLEDVAEQLGQAGIALTAIGVPNGGMITQTSISLKAFITGSRTTLKKRLLSDKVYLPTKSL